MRSRPGSLRVACVGLAAFALGGLAGCAPALDWRAVKLPEVAAEVLLPCRPSVFARTLRLASETVVWTLHSCRADDFNWAIGHATFSNANAAERAQSELMNDATGATGAAAVSPPWRLVPAGAADASKRWHRSARSGDGREIHMHMTLALRERQLVQLLVVGERSDSEAVAFFQDSLQLKAAR